MTDEKHGATPQPETDAPAEGATGLHVALEGFEGPIDLLLSLARDQRLIWRVSPSCDWPNNISRISNRRGVCALRSRRNIW